MKSTIAFGKLAIITIFILTLTGCSFSLQGPFATNTIVPPAATDAPTQPAQATAIPPTAVPTQAATAVPTAVPPTAAPAPTKTPAALFRGFAVFDKAKGAVIGYDLTGKTVLYKYITPGITNMGNLDSQVVGDTLFYWSQSDQTIIEVNKNAALKLTFIPKADVIGFAVSPDGKKIAWSVENYKAQNPASELWIAGIDGKNSRMVTNIDPKNNNKWMVLRPYLWLADGRLLFVQSPTGIGGYILFGGYGGFGIYDPANSANPLITLIDPVSAGGMCVHGISPDLNKAVVSCGTKETGQLGFREISTGNQTNIPMLPEQGAAGSPAYSPSGKWLAYASARNEPDHEAGKIGLVPAAGGDPKVLASFSNGFADVNSWIDEDHILLSTFQGDQPQIWVINRDGSSLARLVDGFFIGLIK